MNLRIRSLQSQLALRLAAVFLVATVLGVAGLLYEGFSSADTLNDQELDRRAAELARHVARGEDGNLRLTLPPGLQQIYNGATSTDLFAVRAPDGRLVAASHPEIGDLVRDWPPADEKASFFRLERFGPSSQDYYGLTRRADGPAGMIDVTVARASDADALAHALLREFVLDVAWVVPPFAAATLAVGVWSIRRGLRSIRAASERAAAIAPNAIGTRLPTEDIPTELLPLVAAVNRALDRLEQGFVIQRQFTANAAHQLRTPLAILTAGLDELQDGASVEKLRADAARMNRLVEQLLRVARLDAVPLDVTARIDLKSVAAEVTSYLAPWAIAQDREIAFVAPEVPVWVRGNADAVADGLRNLIENAVTHAPSHSEVTVTVMPDGAVSVADRGPGVPPKDRQRIFERFWRDRSRKTTGAGLGLAIVSEIARAHGGHIEVGDTPGGGATFQLRFAIDRSQ